MDIGYLVKNRQLDLTRLFKDVADAADDDDFQFVHLNGAGSRSGGRRGR